MKSNPEELKLKIILREKENLIEARKQDLANIRKEIDTAQTKLFEAVEAKQKALDELCQYQDTQIGESSIEDHRDKQIEDYKTRMPASLNKIAHEKPMKPLSITDLETIPEWPKERPR